MTSRGGTEARPRARGRGTAPRRPVVAVVCDLKFLAPYHMHAVGETYLSALSGIAGASPVLVPLMEDVPDVSALLASVDGLFLPGSPSNVDPARYGGESPRDETSLDRRRDAVSLELIHGALARGKPMMAVCRGFQELNVALGGTLHQHLHAAESEPGYAARLDHRADGNAPLNVQYGPAHDVACTEGGVLAGLMGTGPIAVNSLHGQGVDRKAARLRVEARAPDGTIEAVTVEDTGALALGIQWHPEWRPETAPHNAAVLRAFGSALAATIRPSRKTG